MCKVTIVMLMAQSVSDELKNEVCGMNNFNDGLFCLSMLLWRRTATRRPAI